MKIKKIISMNRRDFWAEYVCEHCDNSETSDGYDDKYFHENVVPNMKCKKCGKKSPSDYKPRDPKYDSNHVI